MEHSFIEHLRLKHPDAFEGWDGYEIFIQARERRGEHPLMLACLYNSPKAKPHLHGAFLVYSDSDGNDIIEVGKNEVVQRFNSKRKK